MGLRRENSSSVRKPLLKRWWVWLIIILVVAFLAIPTDSTDDPAVDSDSATGSAEETGEGADSAFDFEIIAGEAGEYGKTIVYNKDTEFEESVVAYYVPAGTYTVTNLGSNSDQINICSDEKAVSAAGWEEPAEAAAELVDAGASATLTIADGQHIEITAPGHWGFKAE